MSALAIAWHASDMRMHTQHWEYIDIGAILSLFHIWDHAVAWTTYSE